ncbi:DapH/DapD/GlmU-related protein [Microbacterium natoriense]
MSTDPRIHPRAFIGEGVTLGRDVTIGPNAVLLGPLTVGDRVWIGPGAVLGTPPEISSLEQNAAWEGHLAHHGVVIGDDVVIRELTTISQGSHRPTRVGSGSWLLNTSYVAHDVEIGRSVTLSSGARVGGHATIGDHVTLGLNATVHQRRAVGAGAMVGMGAGVTRDVIPFSKVYGSPPRRHGLNSYALRKLGVSDAEIDDLTARFDSSVVDFHSYAEHPLLGAHVSDWLTAAAQQDATLKAS